MNIVSTIQTVGEGESIMPIQSAPDTGSNLLTAKRTPQTIRTINKYIDKLPEVIQLKKQRLAYRELIGRQFNRIPLRPRDGLRDIYGTPEGAKYLEYIRLEGDTVNKIISISESVLAQSDKEIGKLIVDSKRAAYVKQQEAIAAQRLIDEREGRIIQDRLKAQDAAIAQAISNPAAAALRTSVAGTDTSVVPSTVVLPDSSTPSTGTSPLTIAAIGFGALKLLAVI